MQRALGAAFALGELIGQGGFGEVWAATDVKLKRDVAVKVLREDLVASPALLERFRREAEAAAKLRHPNIVPIYQVGEAEGLVYFVMPLIKGESLRALLEREGRVEVAEAVRILTEAASALHEAHEEGIVHRDIKPDNILLEGSQRRVLLMDFGIAKSLEVGESGLTGTGMVIGTPQYMSPEQATGEKHIDARSDIYSLGVVAYQMLAGRLPFEADSAQGMIVAHITAAPDPINTVRTGVPEELAAAVMRALAKKPEVRWPTVEAFAEAIRPPVPVSEESPVRWVVKRLKRGVARTGQRLRMYAVAIVVLGAALEVFGQGAVSGAWHFWRRSLQGSTTAENGPYRGGAALPWSRGTYFQSLVFVPLADTALLVGNTNQQGGAAIFDGTDWRMLPVPGTIVPRPVLVGDRIFAASWDGRRTAIYEVRGGRSVLRDSLSERMVYVFGFDSTLVLATTDGAVVRGRPGNWRREGTGVRGRIELIWGDRQRQAAVIRGRDGASLLVYDGARWRAERICPRPDSDQLRCWVVSDGVVLSSGSLIAVGSEETYSRDTQLLSERGLVATLPADSVRWLRRSGSLPSASAFRAVAVRDTGALWLVAKRDSLFDRSTAWRVRANGIDTTGDLRGSVVGAAFLRGSLTVLTAEGVLRSPRGGAFEIVTEAPSSVYAGCDSLDCWSASSVLPDGSSQTKARVRVRLDAGSTARWWLGRSGRLVTETCTEAANNRVVCTVDRTAAVAQRTPLTGLWTTGLGVVATSGRNALRWSAGWIPMRTAGGAPDSIVAFAAGAGSTMVLLSRSAVWRWDSLAQTWTRWQSLPSWLSNPRQIAVDPQGSVAVVVGDGTIAVVRSSGVAMVQAGLGIASAAAVLPDRRAVVSFPTPDDPALGGRLVVTSPLDRPTVSTETIDAPGGSDIYWLGVERVLGGRALELAVAGSGSIHASIRVDALPFSASPWGAIEVHGMPQGAELSIGTGWLQATESDGRRYMMLAEPGRRRVMLVAPSGEIVSEEFVTVTAGRTAVVRYPGARQ